MKLVDWLELKLSVVEEKLQALEENYDEIRLGSIEYDERLKLQGKRDLLLELIDKVS